MEWVKSELDYQLVKSIAKRRQIPTLIAAVLNRRTVPDSEQELRYFIDRSVYEQHSPFLLRGMLPAIRRLLVAKKRRERVLIFGDRDADGITATVVLVYGLRMVGVECEWRVPCGDDAYGLSVAAVEECVEKRISLIVTVDCGISNHKEIQMARTHNIDTIVIDHHNPPATLPPAIVVINPKQKGCRYPYKLLSGCTLAYKFVLAMQYYRAGLYHKQLVALRITPSSLHCAVGMRLDTISHTRYPVRRLWRMVGRLTSGAAGLPRFLAYGVLLTHKPLLLMRILFRRAVVVPLVPDADAAADAALRRESVRSAYHHYIVHKNQLYDYAFHEMAVLAAISAVADMMPLRNENRTIVANGIAGMHHCKNEGLHALLRKRELLHADVTARALAFTIIPLLNAAGRFGHSDLAVQLLLTTDIQEADRLAERMVSIHKHQKSIVEDVWHTHYAEAAESKRALNGHGVIISGDDIPNGVTGLLANKLLGEHETIAIVISLDGQHISGSIRCGDEACATDIAGRFSDAFSNWGGHDRAAGFTVLPAAYQRFSTDIQHYIKTKAHVTTQSSKNTIQIDAEIPRPLLTLALFDKNRMLEPFGQAFPLIVYYTQRVVITRITLLGKRENHAKLLLDTGTVKLPAIFWNCSRYLGTVLRADRTINILYNLECNHFRHNTEQRLSIIDATLVSNGNRA